MRAKVLNEYPERTMALVLARGDEVMSSLQRFATEHNLTASRLTAIGAFESATVGYFDWERKEYERIPVDEQVEVLSLVGDIALDGAKPGFTRTSCWGGATAARLAAICFQPAFDRTLRSWSSTHQRICAGNERWLGTGFSGCLARRRRTR